MYQKQAIKMPDPRSNEPGECRALLSARGRQSLLPGARRRRRGGPRLVTKARREVPMLHDRAGVPPLAPASQTFEITFLQAGRLPDSRLSARGDLRPGFGPGALVCPRRSGAHVWMETDGGAGWGAGEWGAAELFFLDHVRYKED